MWYKNAFRRHLCDMHIDDWNPEFLSQFSSETYLNNLKTAKIQNAMIYFQSHVGLCYYPTKSGKMHQAFVGKEDQIKRLTELCHSEGISVTGYYSLIYNNWAHDQHPEWRIIGKNGLSMRQADIDAHKDRIFRYGLCCPNNPDYRAFVSQQIHEIADYFTFDGMFFDMLFWPQMCRCESCRKRWQKEVGGSLPESENWNDPEWLLHIQKRREWMGEFANWATQELKTLAPHASVEHNFASAVLPEGKLGVSESINEACDYTGGDLYGGIIQQSFTCKFYKNITKNQPFEYMFSRCEPDLKKHTTIKSEDVMLSSMFLTAAHHGATLVIDAIDPVGTMDARVYEQIGKTFAKIIPYENQLCSGKMIEDIGVYYSFKSKFNPHNEPYTNHVCALHTVEHFIYNNICCGITGSYHSILDYKILVASALTDQDQEDFNRIIQYVEKGGNLYFSGGDCTALLKTFFNAHITKRTKESTVYIAPTSSVADCFMYFNEKYPLPFEGTAPIVENMSANTILAHLTLPYTTMNNEKFASIHSNPPGIQTTIPAIAYKEFGKGKVLWSALPIEGESSSVYHSILLDLLKNVFCFEPTISSSAPKNVEITAFEEKNATTINAVLLNSEYKAPSIDSFEILCKTPQTPKEVTLLPNHEPIPFAYSNGVVSFKTRKLNIFDMYRITYK